MATTAHEVSLGVRVESAAAEASLRSLTDNIVSVGAAFNGTVLSQIQRFNNTIRSLTTAVSAAGPAMASLATPLASLSSSLSTFSSTISSARIAPFLGQLSLLTTALNNVNATRLQSQVLAISSALAPGIPQIREYAVAIRQVSSAISRLTSDRIDTYFSSQVAGVTNLVSVLRSGLPSIQGYANALRGIARASAAIGTTSSSIGSLTSQAAGLQLLANTVSANIGNIQAYAAAMRVLGTAMSGIGRGAASISRLVTGMASLAASSGSVVPGLGAITAALLPFTNALRAAATAGGRLVMRLTELQTIARAIPGVIGAGSSSMGIFSSILQIAANSISNQNNLLRQLSVNMRGVAASGKSMDISGNANKSSSAVENLTGKILGFIGGYIGVQALKGFGENIIRTGADFDNAMGMVKAVSRNASDYTTESFMAMEREAFRMGRTTTYSATNAAVALKELTQGGLTTQQAVQSLGDTMALAETEAMSMADASRIVTSMMAQFQASSSELTDYVDKLAKTSAVSKTSIEQLKYAMAYVGTAARSANQPFAEVVSAIGALSTAGVESSQAGTTLRDMLTDLTDTTSYASRKLRGLGLDMSLVDPRANKLSEIIGTLRARGIDAADAMGIFGVRGGLAAGSLITVYKQYMDVLNAVQNQSKGTAAIMQQDVTDNLRKDFDKLAASWDYLVNRIFKSGFGNLMRGLVQQAREFTLQIADMVDTLKNASQFGDLSEIINLSLNIGFGKAVNYYEGILTTATQAAVGTLINTLRLLGDASFWAVMLDLFGSIGAILSAGFKLAAADLLDANKKFAETLIQSVMYAGDLLVDKAKEAAAVFLTGDVLYQSARVQTGLARREYEGFVERKSKEIEVAAKELEASRGTADEPRAKRRLDYESGVLMKESDRLRKDLEAAMAKLSVQERKIGMTSEPRFMADYAAAAKDAGKDISDEWRAGGKKSAEEAAALLPKALKAATGLIANAVLDPVVSSAKDFKPGTSVDTSKDETRLATLLKENAPTIASAPTKTKDVVTSNKVSQGVGPTGLESSTANALNLVVGSMKEVGSGIWTSKFGAVVSPLERATNLNTAATNRLTAALTGGTAGENLKDNTKGIKGKGGQSAAKIEAENQADLGFWSRTGNMPSRLRSRMDSVNAENKAKEDQVIAQQQKNAEVNAQAVERQQRERITATLGTEVKLGNPVTWALKKGISPALDKDGKPIAQPNVRLGLPADIMFGSGRGDFGDSTTLYDLLPQIRRGASSRGNRSERAMTPTDLTTSEIKKLRTFIPKDEGYKQRTLDSDPLSTAPFTMQSGLSYDQEGLKYQLGLLYPDANYTIDERRKQQLLNKSPLENMEFSPLSTLPFDRPLSQMNTPDISGNGDRNGQQQLAQLSNMTTILGEINGNIVKGNAKESQKLSIKIT